MAEEIKTCETCWHSYSNPGYEPCASCGGDCSNWEPINTKKVIVIEEMTRIGKEAEKKYFTVTVALHRTNPCSGFEIMTSTNVLNYYFTDGGIFCAEMDNGEWFMCPKENIHHVKVQQTYKKEN